MIKNFPSLYNLIDEDSSARKFFNSLPNKVKTNLENNASEIKTFEILQEMASNLID